MHTLPRTAVVRLSSFLLIVAGTFGTGYGIGQKLRGNPESKPHNHGPVKPSPVPSGFEVNDGAALAQADLGIAMGTGTDVAIEASDLTLMRPDLGAAADAIRLSRRTLAVIKGNLVWAFAYNVAAIPLAMAWLLSPIVASAAMAFSSVFVVSNSLRLRRFNPTS